MNSLIQFEDFIKAHPQLVIAIMAWSLFWKGLALWRAAHKESRNWFIALLVLNTLGILEIIYLYVITREKSPEQETV